MIGEIAIERIIGDQSGVWRVATFWRVSCRDRLTVEIGDEAVVVLHPQRELVDRRGIVDVKRCANVRRRIVARHRSIERQSDLVIVEVGLVKTDAGQSGRPSRIVKT